MKSLFTFLLAVNTLLLTAQIQVKKSLSIEDFARWETISKPIISNNGKYVAYEQNPEKGDGTLILYSEKQNILLKRGENAAFGAGNDFLVYKIKPTEAEVRKAKIDKVKKEKMPKDSLEIYVFNNDSAIKFPNLKSFKIAEKNSSFVAFLTDPAKAPKDSTKKDEAKKTKPEKQPGDDLVLFNISNSDTTVFKHVTDYFWAKNGQALYFICETKDSAATHSSVFTFRSQTSSVKELFNAEGYAKSVVSDVNGTRYSFLFSKDSIEQKVYSLYLGITNAAPEMIVDGYTRGIPVGWTPSENGKIWFSENGTKLYFGTAQSPKPEPKDTIPEDEKPGLDVWNWKDLKLQPQQKIEAEKENLSCCLSHRIESYDTTGRH